ncbi:MAG: hypothetical protein HY927_08245 [Elusimicrobia bacterium]|nr:hypothetical protein [Elusimicrobiota bacterium]
MTKRQYLALILVVLGVAAFYPFAMGNANAKGDAAVTEADIAFGDPAHKVFFNYQGFLAQHKSGGEMAETWKLLAAPERLKKVREGEAFLEKLHGELLAKPTLTAEEQGLLQAVWGKEETAGIRDDTHHAAIAKEGSAPKEMVNSLSKKIGGFQGKGNWNQMFDGDRLSRNDGVDAAGVSGRRGDTTAQIKFSAKPEVVKRDD